MSREYGSLREFHNIGTFQYVCLEGAQRKPKIFWRIWGECRERWSDSAVGNEPTRFIEVFM
jgi:hypothetical protein